MSRADTPAFKFAVGKVAAWSLILGVTLALLVFGAVFLIPLSIAILIWGLLSATTGHLRRIKIAGRSLPVWAARSLAIFVVLAANLTVYDIFAGQASALQIAAPIYQENFARMLSGITDMLGISEIPTAGILLDFLDVGSMLSWLGSSVGSGITNLMLIIMYVAFLLTEEQQLPVKLARLHSDETSAAKTRALAIDISLQVQRYTWMKTIISLLTGVVSYVILKLVGVDFAAIWALLIFFLNFIPNIGSVLGVLLPALLTLVQFDNFTPFLIVTIGLGTTQFIIGSVLEPAYMGRSLNLSSFMILLSLTFWGLIWGIPGMFLSVPMMVVFAIICSHVDQLRWIAVLLSKDGELMTASARGNEH